MNTLKKTTVLQSNGEKSTPEDNLIVCFHPCLVCVLFVGPTLLEMNFAEMFPLVSVVFFWGGGGVSKPSSSQNPFQDTVSALHLGIRDHTADTAITLQTSTSHTSHRQEYVYTQ